MLLASPEPIRVEKNGRLQATGAAWWEPIADRYELRQMMIYGPMLIYFGALILYFMGARAFGGIKSAVQGVVLTTFAIQVGIYLATEVFKSVYDWTRVYFIVATGEVQITEPHGWFTPATNLKKRRIFALKSRFSSITSIEIVPMKNNQGGHYAFGKSMQLSDTFLAYQVSFFFKDGSSYPVGMNLYEEDARKVQTMLDAAWREAWTAASSTLPKTTTLNPASAELQGHGRSGTPRGQVTEEDF